MSKVAVPPLVRGLPSVSARSVERASSMLRCLEESALACESATFLSSCAVGGRLLFFAFSKRPREGVAVGGSGVEGGEGRRETQEDRRAIYSQSVVVGLAGAGDVLRGGDVLGQEPDEGCGS